MSSPSTSSPSMPMATSTIERFSSAEHVPTMLVLAWGAFAFGAVYEWAFWPLALGCTLIGLRALVRPSSVPHLPDMFTVICLASIAVATLVQLVPLPTSLLVALSPRAAGVLDQLEIAFAWRTVDRHALSIAPHATMTALALYAALVLMLLGVARSVSATGARRLVTLITGLGVALALVGIVQRPFYAGRIYGFWTPLMQASPFGPFVNKNHFAGWMLMAVPLTLGLLCAEASRVARVAPDWRRRLLWLSSPEANRIVCLAAAVVVMALSLVLTMSRSGMLAFAASIALGGWWTMHRMPAGSRRWVMSAYGVCLVLFVVGWTGVDAVAARLGSANPATINERLPIWRDTWRMASDFWLTGTGLNTYGVATLFYQTSMPGFHLREAHNDYFQLAAEGGVLLGVPIACAIVALVRAIRHQLVRSSGSSYWIRLGAVIGLIAIALQSSVEFSLQMPGNAAFCAVLCGIALHRDSRTARARVPTAGARTQSENRSSGDQGIAR